MGPNEHFYKDIPARMLMRATVKNSGHCNSMEGQTVDGHVHTQHCLH